MTRQIPILFIHGFNGDPGDWTDGGFRDYLIEEADLNPDLVHLFRYGIAEDGTYNNRGDLRQIASRLAGVGLNETEMLASSVDRLSRDSVEKGGPAQVTLIAHSLGGIISRYYLSCRAEDDFGTVYRGNVGRLIQIASPNRGVDLLKLTELTPPGSLLWRFIRLLERLGLAPALPASAVDAWEASLAEQQLAERAAFAPEVNMPGARVMLTDTPIYQQLAPDSPLLAKLNTPGAMPAEVACHTFYGDIRLRVLITLGEGGFKLLDHAVSFGDMAVPAHSAREIPGVQVTAHPFVTEKLIELNLWVRTPETDMRSLAALLPDTAHGKLLSNQAVFDGVLSLLND